MQELKTIQLDVAGLGLILYSPFATAQIPRGQKYLEAHYWEPADVARHVRAGTIAGFCTGSPGKYRVRFALGKPDTRAVVTHPWAIRLAVQVKDRTLCVRDLYDLQGWEPECPPEQMLTVDDGNYSLFVGTTPTDSGIVGDEQDIIVCLEPVDVLPELTWEGVPFLGEDTEDTKDTKDTKDTSG
jgi:hypothetical protein